MRNGIPMTLAVDSAGALIVTQDAPVVTLTVTETLGTIAVSGTFQVAMAANPARAVGGSISNHGAALMLVAFGTTAAGRGVQVIPGGTLFLASVFPTEPFLGIVSITGTDTQTFTSTQLTRVVT